MPEAERPPSRSCCRPRGPYYATAPVTVPASADLSEPTSTLLSWFSLCHRISWRLRKRCRRARAGLLLLLELQLVEPEIVVGHVDLHLDDVAGRIKQKLNRPFVEPGEILTPFDHERIEVPVRQIADQVGIGDEADDELAALEGDRGVTVHRAAVGTRVSLEPMRWARPLDPPALELRAFLRVPWHEYEPRYPRDWPEIVSSAHRAATGRERLSEQDLALYDKLDQPMTVAFEDQTFEEVIDELQQGQALIVSGNYLEALYHLRQALRQSPDDAAAAALIDECNQRIQTDEDHTEMVGRMLKRAIDLYASRRFSEALASFREILRLDGDNALAAEYEQKTNINIQNRKQALIVQSNNLADRGDLGGAVNALEKALRYDPDDTWIGGRIKTLNRKMRDAAKAKQSAYEKG